VSPATAPAEWGFLTNHARALVCIARDPGIRLSDIAAALGVTERTAVNIVSELTETGYAVKEKHGRRNRYRVERHLPLPETVTGAQPIGEVLDALLATEHH
jgi:DNA-binding MarR family transcriptional regulator